VLTIVSTGRAQADAVRPPPDDCPQGWTAHTDHGGPYCLEPPPTCKTDETARARYKKWYCEPPPPKGGCPAGSEWTSRSATDAWCDGQRSSCVGPWGKDNKNCLSTSLCVKEIKRSCPARSGCDTYIEERVASVCARSKRCPRGTKCIVARRYVRPPPEKKSQLGTKLVGLILLPLFAGAMLLGVHVRRRRRFTA